MKKCKGTGLCISYGCGDIIQKPIKYGLCKNCFIKWLNTTDTGRTYFKRITEKAKEKETERKSKALAKLYKKDRRKPTSLENMTFNQLKSVTQKVCNQYIKLRDNANFGFCISSDYASQIHDAGHYFSIGSNEAIRYSPQNIHGQNRRDNSYLSGNLINYEKGLINRFGQAYFDELCQLNSEMKRSKILDFEYVLKVNRTYKHLINKGIWVFKHIEFIDIMNSIND